MDKVTRQRGKQDLPIDLFCTTMDGKFKSSFGQERTADVLASLAIWPFTTALLALLMPLVIFVGPFWRLYAAQSVNDPHCRPSGPGKRSIERTSCDRFFHAMEN